MSTATTKQRAINLLLIAHFALVRQSMASLLSNEPDFKIVAQCSSVTEALKVIKQGTIDVVLIDTDVGQSEIKHFLPAVRKQSLQGRILLLAGDVNDDDSADLLRAGICGIFQKGDTAAQLVHAVRDVAAGNLWLHQEELEKALSFEKAGAPDSQEGLTKRERQVLSLVSEGLKNREIGMRIGVPEGSVKAAMQQLFSKFGVRSRSKLVRIALEQHKNQA